MGLSNQTIWRRLACAAGFVGIVPLLLLDALAMTTPVTVLGAAWLTTLTSLMLGCISAPWRELRIRGVCRVTLVLLAVLLGVASILPVNGARIRLVNLPDHRGASVLDKLVNERDVVLFGGRLFQLLGLTTSRENAGLQAALEAAYRIMNQGGGATRSGPAVRTLLGWQTPADFDAIIIEPQGSPVAGVVFLHGFGGNFALEGWLVAGIFQSIIPGAIVIAPSSSLVGDWRTVAARRTVEESISYLKRRGIKKIYLCGLSNGAYGASRLAPSLKAQLSGLVLISGADGQAPPAGVRTLVMFGNQDWRFSVEQEIRPYIARDPRFITYVELAADHFMLLKQPDQLREILTQWLEMSKTKEHIPSPSIGRQ